MKIIKIFLKLLSSSEKKDGLILLCMIVIMALLDAVGVASIMPFISVLAKPEIIQSNSVLRYIYQELKFNNEKDFILALGIIFFLFLILSLLFKALTTYIQSRFTLMAEYGLSKRFVEGYLNQPYSWFLNRNSADLGKTILSEVSNLIHGGLLPSMTLIAQTVVSLALITLLIIVNPWLTLTVCFVLSTAYVMAYKFMSKYLNLLGEFRLTANQQRYTILNEAFGGIKQIKVSGLEQNYVYNYSIPSKIYAEVQSKFQVIGQLPRFVLEAVAFGGMLLVVLYLVAESGNFLDAVPIISLFAFAGYRLLPAMQQIYYAMTQIRYMGPVLEFLHNESISLEKYKKNKLEVISMPLKQGIELNRIDFKYPNSQHNVLNGVSLYIPVNTTVAFVGSTGSGKTTVIDLILGLLEPQKGGLWVDGIEITNANRRLWQKNIGYVPQHIYLSDDTVTANIAFGIESKCINHANVVRAAQIANLHEFVVKDMPNGYQTKVGEDGVRLSGGQRQRIGIARALYHSPKVLILDEATSALDNLTEKAVMQEINKLGNEITIILIAHRLSTVRECDEIIVLEHGSVIAKGTFDELIVNSANFRSMAGNH